MKMTLISVTSKWLCATGVAVVASYCILTRSNSQGKADGRQEAAQVASRVSKRGTIPEYKSANRHSSAIKKTTTATVVKEVKVPTFVQNPVYSSLTNTLEQLTKEVAETAKDGEVALANGFVLVNKDGKPTLKFPEQYTKVGIGGVAIGDELKGDSFSSHRKESTTRISGCSMKLLSVATSVLTGRSSTARMLPTRRFPLPDRLIPFGCMGTCA